MKKACKAQELKLWAVFDRKKKTMQQKKDR